MSRIEDRIVSAAPAVGVVFVVAGLLGFVIAGTYAALHVDSSLAGVFLKNPAANIGIPCSALAAFAIVSTLWRAFPPSESAGQLELTIFGLKFTGPSGPISLWVVCFLAFILATDLLKLERIVG